uniref:Rhodanese domain-containing protein n=1 Tax=Aegilops tauschii subsp. strangulata TaxID=200361 RepID=A0A453NZP8_AEGTS
RQAKEMAAARRRWETLIREQKIKTLTPREAGYTFKLTDKVLLDVRPSNERQKAWVKGSTWIPVFDVDTSSDLNGLSKKAFNFMIGGWWSGSSTMSFNKELCTADRGEVLKRYRYHPSMPEGTEINCCR